MRSPAAAALSILSTLYLAAPAAAQPDESEYRPDVKAASDEARAAMAKFQLAPGLKVELFAAEPLLANPVAFCIDHKGRFYVAETFRLHKGVTDNRSHDAQWLADDIACRTVEDRVAMYRKHLGAKFSSYSVEHERIRMVADDDGDGVADRATVFADGFKEVPDGIAAGLLAQRDGGLWYTCIPKLWLLNDDDGDGVADRRKAMHDGFGVHTALLGHDMHGLCWGPDGKLYFSIGDRGFNLVTREGRELFYPDTGAVLRCNRDGSELEVFASGLRNPQELAFDRYGNLFTGDNNSDGGDKARWVYVAEGGDSGWRISYQDLRTRGPWNEDKLWHPYFRGQAAWILPPIANLASGPSGLTYYPGTGLPQRYDHHFFLCDFRGASGISGVHAFSVVPKGASFELTETSKLIWRVLPTDVDFGPDGAMYISDWTEGWNQTGKGRIYRIAPPGLRDDPAVAETAALLREGVDGRDTEAQLALLRHRDQRVRQLAQFALAGKGEAVAGALAGVASSSDAQLARIHAIWALHQVARTRPGTVFAAKILAPVQKLLSDADAEIRAQAAKALGGADVPSAGADLTRMLADPNARVRYFAAMGVAKLGEADAAAQILAMLRDNADADPFLRHACVMALTSIGAKPAGKQALTDASKDASSAVRMGVLLAWRRLGDEALARFLRDPDPILVVEAARAIHDLQLGGGLAELAAVLESGETGSRPLLRRAIDANFRLGDAEHAQRLAALAVRSQVDTAMRVEAVAALGIWPEPPGRDRVMALWRPLPARPPTFAQQALGPVVEGLLTDETEKVQLATLQAVARLPLLDAAPLVIQRLGDKRERVAVRTAALAVLERWKYTDLLLVAKHMAGCDVSALRQQALRITAALEPDEALPLIDRVLENAPMDERRNGLRILASMPEGKADEITIRWLGRLQRGEVPTRIRLDLILAAGKRNSAEVAAQLAAYEASKPAEDPLSPWIEAVAGGDAKAGKRIFRNHAAATCTKCHSVDGKGGDAGPDLKGVGMRLLRRQLLESLVLPSANITDGFGTSVLTMNNGSVHAGMVKREDDKTLTLQPTEGAEVVLEKAKIISRSDPVSSMPPVPGVLTVRQIRDVLEYLASLK